MHSALQSLLFTRLRFCRVQLSMLTRRQRSPPRQTKLVVLLWTPLLLPILVTWVFLSVPLKSELSYTGHRCPTTPPIRRGSIVIDSSFPQGTVQCFFIHGSTLPDLIFRWKKLRTSVNTTR